MRYIFKILVRISQRLYKGWGFFLLWLFFSRRPTILLIYRNYQPLARSGYFREDITRSSDPICVVTDPTTVFKWHTLHCGGPEVASFVCELPGIQYFLFSLNHNTITYIRNFTRTIIIAPTMVYLSSTKLWASAQQIKF